MFKRLNVYTSRRRVLLLRSHVKCQIPNCIYESRGSCRVACEVCRRLPLSPTYNPLDLVVEHHTTVAKLGPIQMQMQTARFRVPLGARPPPEHRPHANLADTPETDENRD